MVKHLKDVVIKVGTYTDRSGEKKGRYKTIGKLMRGDDGDYLLLDPFVNLAAVPREADRDMITASLYEPREARGGAPAATGDDKIPF